MPVAVVASQPRHLETQHDADLSKSDVGNQFLKADNGGGWKPADEGGGAGSEVGGEIAMLRDVGGDVGAAELVVE